MLPGLSRYLQHHPGFTISISFHVSRSNRDHAAYPRRSLSTPSGLMSYTPFRPAFRLDMASNNMVNIYLKPQDAKITHGAMV